MSRSMALLSSSPLPPPSSTSKPNFSHKPTFFHRSRKPLLLLSDLKASSSSDNGAGRFSPSAVTVEEPESEKSLEISRSVEEKAALGFNGAAPVAAAGGEVKEVSNFVDPRWIGGTWDLKQFQKDGKTDWDAVIDAEVRRRKWLEGNPESTSNDDPVVFDTSIIPWWAWMKRFHLPEAELLNGRAAMIGFFMAYLVDSLTGVGLVDQMSNFFCKTLLFVAVVGVLLIRKNEDVETFKKLLEETTFYDKQWKATWQDENSGGQKSD